MATAWLLRHRLAGRAKRRLYLIKRRMPFLLDLLTLLMEAGSTFLNAMRQAVEEFRGHPVAEEFGRVLSDMNMGKTRVEAFQAMRTGWPTTKSPASSARSCKANTWERRWGRYSARRPTCCG